MPGIFPAPARVKIALPDLPQGAGFSLPLFRGFLRNSGKQNITYHIKTDKIIKKAAMA